VKFKQLLGAILFMVFTTTVVDAHALSHLFDGNLVSIQDCDVCEEFTLTAEEDYQFNSPTSFEIYFTTLMILDGESLVTYSSLTPSAQFPGKYYNKPPPLT